MEVEDPSSSEDSLHSIPTDELYSFHSHPWNPSPSPFAYLDFECSPSVIRAVFLSNASLLQQLIRDGKSIKVRDNMHRTPLHTAMLKNSMEVLSILLDHPEIDLNAVDYDNNTPLLVALGMASDEMIYRLLEAGCNINATNHTGHTALHIAISSHPTVVEQLIKRGADVNASCFIEGTPLHVAIRKNSFEFVCMLLYHGADTTISDDGITPLLLSIGSGANMKIVHELLNYCSDFSPRDDEDFNCLLLALYCYHPIVVDLLEVVGDEINQVSSTGFSALHLSLRFPTDEIFKLVWPKIDRSVVLESSINLLTILMDSPFPNEQWLDCVYTILDSSLIVDLLTVWKGSVSFFTYLFVNSFNRDNIELSDRVKIIYAFLSYGAPVIKRDINLAYTLFGLGDELYAFTNVDYQDNVGGEQLCMLLKYIMAKEHLYRIQDNQKFSFEDVLYPKFYKENILTLSSYFSFPWLQLAVDKIKTRAEAYNALFLDIEGLPKFPTLLELSRNKVRMYILNKHRISKTYQFYHLVHNLNVPYTIKQIILFQKPLYKVGYRDSN